MNITIEKDELKKIIKVAIKEIIEEEKIENFFNLIPAVLEEEMQNINKTYGKPNKKINTVYTEEIDVWN